MKTKFAKLSFITPLLVMVVGVLIVITYSFVVYSSYVLFTEGTAMSIYGINKSNVYQIHSIVKGNLLTKDKADEEAYLQLSKNIEQINNLVIQGGEYISNDNKVFLPASTGEALVVSKKAAEVWAKYKALSDDILKTPFLEELQIVAVSDGEEERNHTVTAFLPSKTLPAKISELNKLNTELVQLYDKGAEVYTQSFMQKQIVIQVGIFISVVLCLATFLVTYFVVLRKMILKPLAKISAVSKQVALGDISQPIGIKQNNEIGELAQSMNQVIDRFKESSEFANKIGSGSFDSDFSMASEQDELGRALLGMKENLLNVAIEDKKRNWTTEGFAKFGDILRSKGENMEEMTYAIISNLIKYLQANQGSIYVLEEEQNEQMLVMKSCYAYGKKKFVNHTLAVGEGLLGQAVLEKDIIFLTDIPQNYIKITSGLGEASPNCILIAPLQVNGEVYGALEIASFKKFEAHEIEFIKKLSETIAATISSVKINEKTRILLEDSQQLTEQMRAQEEEMRQNVEELSATQEEMERKHRELAAMKEIMEEEIAEKNALIQRLLAEEPRLQSLV